SPVGTLHRRVQHAARCPPDVGPGAVALNKGNDGVLGHVEPPGLHGDGPAVGRGPERLGTVQLVQRVVLLPQRCTNLAVVEHTPRTAPAASGKAGPALRRRRRDPGSAAVARGPGAAASPGTPPRSGRSPTSRKTGGPPGVPLPTAPGPAPGSGRTPRFPRRCWARRWSARSPPPRYIGRRGPPAWWIPRRAAGSKARGSSGDGPPPAPRS